MKKKLSTSIEKNLLSQYLALVFLLQPFYSDDRGKQTRAKARKILSISIKEEEKILKSLLKQEKLIRIGDFLVVTNRPSAIRNVNNLIDKNKLNLDKLINQFI